MIIKNMGPDAPLLMSDITYMDTGRGHTTYSRNNSLYVVLGKSYYIYKHQTFVALLTLNGNVMYMHEAWLRHFKKIL